MPANWLRSIFPALLIKTPIANTIFPVYFPDGAVASSAASVLAGSGDLRSCSTRASRSSDTLSGSFSPAFLPERAHRPQVGTSAGVEGALELLGVSLAILVQNMSIHAGDHVDLGVACIALGGLHVAVVAFQFVGGSGMTERMPYS